MHPLAQEVQVAAALGDAFSQLCPRKARSFRPQSRQLASDLLGCAEQKAYAILDGARAAEAIKHVADLPIETQNLFEHDADAEVSALGPRLVALSDRVAFERLFPMLWGEARAIFLCAKADTHAVADVLKPLLFAELSNGELAIMRFYDPRVLRRMWDALEPEQQAAFFSDVISAYFLEDEKGNVLRLGPPQVEP